MDKIIGRDCRRKIAKGDQVLVSYALGSCVGLPYDWQEHRRHGLCHPALHGVCLDKTNPYVCDQGVRTGYGEMEPMVL